MREINLKRFPLLYPFSIWKNIVQSVTQRFREFDQIIQFVHLSSCLVKYFDIFLEIIPSGNKDWFAAIFFLSFKIAFSALISLNVGVALHKRSSENQCYLIMVREHTNQYLLKHKKEHNTVNKNLVYLLLYRISKVVLVSL